MHDHCLNTDDDILCPDKITLFFRETEIVVHSAAIILSPESAVTKYQYIIIIAWRADRSTVGAMKKLETCNN